jgi:DnaK suppressor protein
VVQLHKALVARGAAVGDALAGEVENLRGTRTDQTGDSAVGAFDSGSDEISTQLSVLEARELNQINRALTRLTQGTYGICEVCEEKIPVARLKALPYSTTCVNCQREIEPARWRGLGENRLHGTRAGGSARDVDLTDIKKDLSSNHCRWASGQWNEPSRSEQWNHITEKSYMNADRPAAGAGHSSLAGFTAKLTDAAYAVALRHGVSGSWIDLQLDLWRVLTEVVARSESPPTGRLDAFEA